jgi:alkanesulfonate monooxygenase SsuD/methylene tetrahydromethanopterin reductase-like flavin-dependent oxidoreductase (luciferase family)
LGFGAKVDNYGAHVRMFGLMLPAVRAEAAGVDSLWLTDHVLMKTSTKSSFPFSDDGAAHWNPDDP